MQVDAARAHLLVRDPDEGDDEGDEAVLAGTRVAGALGRHPASAEHLDIGLAQLAEAHEAHQDRDHLVAVVGNGHADAGEALLEAVEMVVEAEELAAPHMDHVVGDVGARETPVEDRYPRLGDRRIGAVDEGGAVRKAVLQPHDALRRRFRDPCHQRSPRFANSDSATVCRIARAGATVAGATV